MRFGLFLSSVSISTLALSSALVGCSDDPYCFNCGPSDASSTIDSQLVDAADTGMLDTNVEAQADANKCPQGTADCNQIEFDGCESYLSTDKYNCGACNVACALAHAETSCVASNCAVDKCKTGYLDCDKKATNGCEADITLDTNNCGACGTPCPQMANAKSTCKASKCDGFECLDGFADCNGNAADGCEINLRTDPVNCGKCNTTCDAKAHAAPGCKAGICDVGACDPGYGNCDTSVWSGCEALLAADANNCGACGQKCPDMPGGLPACVKSECVVGGCNAGYADCDKLPNGCEVNLANDIANCGACDNVCPAVTNGTPKCSFFKCGIDKCKAGFDHCYGDESSGCETDLMNDVHRCGACNNDCADVPNGTSVCNSGSCDVGTCNPFSDNCNHILADGCETLLLNDPLNCSGCNNVCPTPQNGTPGCLLGTCGIDTCNTGFSNCNNDLNDGCERNTSNDPKNCGGCDIVCGSGECNAGQCKCNNKVLLLADDSVAGSTALGTALTAQGMVVTQPAIASYQYNGTNPATAGFGAIIILAGGALSSSTDMPLAGQKAIADFVDAGNGLILTEWAALHVSAGRWTTLAPLVLLERTLSFSGQVTYNLETGFKNHPIWPNATNLPFTFASTSNVGATKLGAGISRLASSPQAVDAVAIRNLPNKGRIVHVAHAGNFASNGWSNANIQKLVGNAAQWSARCK